MPSETQAVIMAAVRTPIGALGGALSTIPAPELGAACIHEVIRRSGLPAKDLDEVIMGNVISAGLGQNPARQAAIAAGVPTSVGATTVNKVCGSALKAIALATQSIRLGEAHVVVAGGMESMSRAPYLLPRARQGYRMGHGELLDAMIHDGLWDIYNRHPMGYFGDRCAIKFGFTREQQDDYAVRSYTRAQQAAAKGVFLSEMVEVEVPDRGGATTVGEDEPLGRFDEGKLRALRPAFAEDGTVTAGNASSVNDGAAAVLIASRERSASLAAQPIARIVGLASYSGDPAWFTTAPIGAIEKLLQRIDWLPNDVDLFEINEAFANVAMAAQQELRIPDDKINIYGGAVALGHPIGATGARILVTLLTGLERTGAERGVACLCIGGGEALAVAVERLA